jgi:transcriptional regulator with XRE-family HTH domain
VPRHPDAIIALNRIVAKARQDLWSPRRLGQRLSRGELADAVNRALDRLYPRRDLAAFYVDDRWVGKLERGETRWPSAERRAALREVFGVANDGDLDLFSPRRTELPRVDTGMPVHAEDGDWEQTLADLHIEWRLLVDNDKVFGPAYAFAGVSRQLNMLDTLLDEVPEKFNSALSKLTARYCESAAWLSQSLDHDAAAERWTQRSLDLASRAGDTTMIAWANYRSSQHWLSRKTPHRAADTADLAASLDTKLPAPMRAAIRVQQAHAHAARGEHDDALALIDQAHGGFRQWKHLPRRVRRISRRASSNRRSYGVGC